MAEDLDDEDLEGDLEAIEAEVAALQRQGDDSQAVMGMEQLFVLCIEGFGPTSDKTVEACERLTTSYNTLAMQLVERREFDEAYELLKKAEVLTDDQGCLENDRARRLRLSAVTFNNMGCFFKRRSKLHAALQYLFRALEVELQTESAENPAATHLNICATFSQMGRHEEAHEHAEKAIMQLQAEWDSSECPTEQHPTNKSFLAMAYHNLAVEQEYLHYWEEACRSYCHAHRLAQQAWGASSPMTTALHKSLMGFQRKKTVAEKKEADAALRELSSRTARAGISGRGGAQGDGHRPGQGRGLPSPRLQSAFCSRQATRLDHRHTRESSWERADSQQYSRQQRPSSAPLRKAPVTPRDDVIREREIYTRRGGSMSARGGSSEPRPGPVDVARRPMSAQHTSSPYAQTPSVPTRKPKSTPRGSYTDRSARADLREFDPQSVFIRKPKTTPRESRTDRSEEADFRYFDPYSARGK